MEEAAQAAGVSVRTAYKWLAQSSATKARLACSIALQGLEACPRGTPKEAVGQLVAHWQQRRTCRQIADEPQLAASTVGRLLRRAG